MSPQAEDTNSISETSPLLSKNAVATVDADAGKAPNGTTEALVSSGANEEGPIERQAGDDEGRRKQFDGMPEMRKKMKYIMPAVGIGVSSGSLARSKHKV